MPAKSRRSKALTASLSSSRRRVPAKSVTFESTKPGDGEEAGGKGAMKSRGRRRNVDDNNKENVSLIRSRKCTNSRLATNKKQTASKRARFEQEKSDDDDDDDDDGIKAKAEPTRRRRTARALVPGGLDASTAAALAARSAAAAIPSSSSSAEAAAAPTFLFEAEDNDEEITEYERQRAERIRRNHEMLAALQVREAAARAAASAASAAAANLRTTRPPLPPRDRNGSGPSSRTGRGSAPTRASARTRGLEPGSDVDAAAVASSSSRCSTSAAAAAAAGSDGREFAGGDLLTIEDYWKERGGNPCPDPIVSDGTYKGWVAPDVCKRFGIEATREATWHAFPGVTPFTKKKISEKSIPPELRGKGWSEARAHAATQLRRNPNAFFYRHVEPGQLQANGEWGHEEHELFLKVAREHGVGDKWGLFASHLPHRVGYQASAYYREVVIPRGEAIDSRFRMTRRTGKAVFVG